MSDDGWRGDGAQEREALAPVIPLFGGGPAGSTGRADAEAGRSRKQTVAAARGESDGEAVLLRRLRAKQLSVSEARQVLRDAGASAEEIAEIIVRFEEHSYLDDAALAGQIIRSAVERKGQGRVVIGRTLSQRGIPRDIADVALDELPDDDEERALDFARGKARSLARYETETALRRLSGQLARRGYRGDIALRVARTALREVQGGARHPFSPQGAASVRFEASDDAE